jgi:hypothetical protein
MWILFMLVEATVLDPLAREDTDLNDPSVRARQTMGWVAAADGTLAVSGHVHEGASPRATEPLGLAEPQGEKSREVVVSSTVHHQNSSSAAVSPTVHRQNNSSAAVPSTHGVDGSPASLVDSSEMFLCGASRNNVKCRAYQMRAAAKTACDGDAECCASDEMKNGGDSCELVAPFLALLESNVLDDQLKKHVDLDVLTRDQLKPYYIIERKTTDCKTAFGDLKSGFSKLKLITEKADKLVDSAAKVNGETHVLTLAGTKEFLGEVNEFVSQTPTKSMPDFLTAPQYETQKDQCFKGVQFYRGESDSKLKATVLTLEESFDKQYERIRKGIYDATVKVEVAVASVTKAMETYAEDVDARRVAILAKQAECVKKDNRLPQADVPEFNKLFADEADKFKRELSTHLDKFGKPETSDTNEVAFQAAKAVILAAFENVKQETNGWAKAVECDKKETVNLGWIEKTLGAARDKAPYVNAKGSIDEAVGKCEKIEKLPEKSTQ